MAAKRKKAGGKLRPSEKRRLALLREALGYVLPEEQAERAVDGMLGTLGSFGAIVTAPEGELARIPGMDAGSARFIKLIMDLARACMEDQAELMKRVTDTRSAMELFRPKFIGRKTEAVCLMLLDSQMRLLYNDVLNEGSIGAVPVYIRRLVRLCIDHNAQVAVLAHNHPSGRALPSQEDIVVTRQIQAALMSIDATLLDHIIFAGDDVMSFQECGILRTGAAKIIRERREDAEDARKMADELHWEDD